ncbi:uncharacterized protein EDB93DRAFT_1258067 [Suillus bovinus]|uniref:uncharacterized protein n=1 Tax=Suillus bovinus TaxID=48563 RepID=UPI001B869495|nr:uncharacterized protein EDB93DRAFT_1258067 [Suillus bovinus]KAG2125644.1 hypothetical protein EDB93DRAFT_1258067 [Suillus bovinus]
MLPLLPNERCLQRDEPHLNPAIAIQTGVLALRLVDHPDWSMTFNDLAAQLCSRFQHRSNDEDFGSGYRTSQGGAGLVPGRLRQSVHETKSLSASTIHLR